MTSKPVGFFDSGVGGLTVLGSTRRIHPELSFCYFGDTAHCPYGDRPLEEVRQFALEAVNLLVSRECDPIVMACNISSSIALEEARRRHPDREIFGLINHNLVREISSRSRGVVGVMATAGTVKSMRYTEVLEEAGLTVYQQACSPLVPLVEEGHTAGEIVINTLEPLVEPLLKQNVDTIVLGCTHYPLLRSSLRDLIPDAVEIIDPGRVMGYWLSEKLPSPNGTKPDQRFLVSGESESVKQALVENFQFSAPEVCTLPDHRPLGDIRT